MNFKHEGYHNVNCISKSSGIEITEAHGDEDVFPSSSLLSEYVSFEGCELVMHVKCIHELCIIILIFQSYLHHIRVIS